MEHTIPKGEENGKIGVSAEVPAAPMESLFTEDHDGVDADGAAGGDPTGGGGDGAEEQRDSGVCGITVPGYAAAKGGVAQLTKALANEWAGRNVQVNATAPGYIATDNTTALRADAVRNRAILARIPAGRWGKAEDFAGAAVFLASPASDYVSGTVLTVDGGWMGR
jgi:NAD(P)-dependent dehydrogenase (short-subunit alcohol dehydrogenase family)